MTRVTQGLQQWEYITYPLYPLAEKFSVIEGYLNEFGKEGWELVVSINVKDSGAYLIFKRPKYLEE
jgi:hypothetical protein